MMRIRLIGLVGIFALMAGDGLAGPSDRTTNTLVNTSSALGSADWDNTKVRGLVKAGKCKVQIIIRKATALAGEDLVCLVEADSVQVVPGGFSSVLAGTVDANGKLRMKADLRSSGCSLLDNVVSFNNNVTCYKATVGTGIGEYDFETECTDAGMVLFPNDLFGDFDEGNMVGTCGGDVGERIPPPAGSSVCASGTFTKGP